MLYAWSGLCYTTRRRMTRLAEMTVKISDEILKLHFANILVLRSEYRVIQNTSGSRVGYFRCHELEVVDDVIGNKTNIEVSKPDCQWLSREIYRKTSRPTSPLSLLPIEHLRLEACNPLISSTL